MNTFVKHPAVPFAGRRKEIAAFVAVIIAVVIVDKIIDGKIENEFVFAFLHCMDIKFFVFLYRLGFSISVCRKHAAVIVYSDTYTASAADAEQYYKNRNDDKNFIFHISF